MTDVASRDGFVEKELDLDIFTVGGSNFRSLFRITQRPFSLRKLLVLFFHARLGFPPLGFLQTVHAHLY